jgi:hypothetical protein
MKRSEYREIYFAFNNYLQKSEQQLLREDLIYENLILNEGLRDLADKFGREGILWLTLTSSINMFGLKATAQTFNASEEQVESITENPPPGVENATKADKFVISQSMENMSKTEKFDEVLTLDDFDFKKENIEDFENELAASDFVTTGDMPVENMSGIFIKETFKSNDQNKKIIQAIIKKGMEIYESGKSNRVFYIKVNNLKYAIAVNPNISNSNSTSLVSKSATNITESILKHTLPNITAGDDESKEKFKQCRLTFHDTLNNIIFEDLIKNTNSAIASYFDANVYRNIFNRCFFKEAEKIKSVKFSINEGDLAGIITLRWIFFQDHLDSLKALNPEWQHVSKEMMSEFLVHELGHLLSDQSGSNIMAKHEISELYNGISLKRFRVKDVNSYIALQNFNRLGVLDNLEELGVKREDIDTYDVSDYLSEKATKKLTKVSVYLIKQMLGGGAIVKGEDNYFYWTFADKDKNKYLYYMSLEERIENFKNWVSSVRLKNQKHKTIEKFFDELLEYTSDLSKDSEFLSDMKDFAEDDREENDNRNIDKLVDEINGKRARDSFDYYLRYEMKIKGIKSSDLNRFLNLLNFSRFGKDSGNFEKGRKYLNFSIENLKKMFEENFKGHDH